MIITRIIFSIKLCFRFRQKLKLWSQTPYAKLNSILERSGQQWQALGIKALVLDFDGVLAAHGEDFPNEKVLKWLQELQNTYQTQGSLFLLSNKPTKVRQAYFAKHFPNITFIVAKRKKPYPDGLDEIAAHLCCQRDEAVVIDDRLATGVIAAIAGNYKACWITKPYRNVVKRPCKEIFFSFLRFSEKVFLL